MDIKNIDHDNDMQSINASRGVEEIKTYNNVTSGQTDRPHA